MANLGTERTSSTMISGVQEKSSMRQVDAEETFRFACHSGVPCFGECCRKLRLMLTPYDVVMLRKALAMSSKEFIDRYTTLEFNPPSFAPLLFLKMNETSENECPFLSPQGCSVYPHRPSACRIYPVARATKFHSVHDVLMESFFIIKEDHCRGFERGDLWRISEWISDQGLACYIKANDDWTKIVMHPALKRGLSEKQQQIFYMASYDMDLFKRFVSSPRFVSVMVPDGEELERLMVDDVKLLDFGLRWLRFVLFGEKLY